VRIFTVLRSSAEYKPELVQALDRQLQKYAPLYRHVCLSDVDVPGVDCEPLWHGYHGWWSKLELFRPDIKGDILFMDLDTVLVGPLDDILKQRRCTMLRDFYRDGVRKKEGLQSSLMFLPEAGRAPVWADWIANPTKHMADHARGGDQVFLEKHYLASAQRWQDAVPGQVVSWKVNCKYGIVAPGARIVCFHGQPRPWGVTQFKDLY
jgi:hypothetical protein